MATSFTVEFVLYRASCRVTGKVYLGQTTQPLKKRWAHHVYMAKTGKKGGCSAFHAALAKYGTGEFDLEAIGAYGSRDALNEAEATAIASHNSLSPNGYNLKAGGSASAHSPETRAKMSAARKAQGNFRQGKLHSAETKALQSTKARGRDMNAAREVNQSREIKDKRVCAWHRNRHWNMH